MSVRICARAGRRHGAFTLIELLVVVAIITLLLSLLLPSLKAAREQAKQVVCLVNQRNMGQAAGFYAGDNNGLVVRSEEDHMHYAASLIKPLGHVDVKLVDFDEDGKLEYLDSLWHDLELYSETLAGIKHFQCPSFPRPEQTLDYVVNGFMIPYEKQPSDDPDSPPDGDSGPSNSYGRQTLFSGIDQLNLIVTTRTRIWSAKRRLTRVRVPGGYLQPSEKIYLTELHRLSAVPGESGWGGHFDAFFFSHLPFASEAPRISNDFRHPGGVTALFFDGRADVLKFHEIDPGFPRRLDDRLRLFTVYEETGS